MNLYVGDHVVVRSDSAFPKQAGLTGIILKIDRLLGLGLTLQIQYDPGQEHHPWIVERITKSNPYPKTNSYYASDLMICNLEHSPMEPPEMELEEIERAQEVLHDLQGR